MNLGTTIVRVSATDADSGLFAVIEYSLVDGEGKFGIKPSTVSYRKKQLMIRHHNSPSVLGVNTEPHPAWKLKFK